MTNPPFQDFLCGVYYMQFVDESLVSPWMDIRWILVRHQPERKYDGAILEARDRLYTKCWRSLIRRRAKGDAPLKPRQN